MAAFSSMAPELVSKAGLSVPKMSGHSSDSPVPPNRVAFPPANLREQHLPADRLRMQGALTVKAVSTAAPKAASPAAIDTFGDEYADDDEFYEVPVHTVTVHDRQRGVTHTFQVPEDQYILHTGEEEGIELPFACRHGCCTACAVRVKSGEIVQPRALGISPELKAKGYALMCVGIPQSDLEVETQDEDEVYWLQFGRYFARGPVERDDYALELALQDE